MRLPAGVGVWAENVAGCGGARVMAAKAIELGLGHIAVKNADGRLEQEHEAIRELVARVRSGGVEVWVWPFAGYTSSTTERAFAEGKAQAYMALSVGATGIMPNIEVSDGSPWYRNSPARATAYLGGIRSVAPALPIGFCSYPWPSEQGDTPWAAFLGGSDFVAPQVYYATIGGTPLKCLQRTIRELKPYKKPVYPLAGDTAQSRLTGQSLKEFAAAVAVNGLSSYGIYHWAGQHTPWDAVGELCRSVLKVVRPDGMPILCHPVEAKGETVVDLRSVAEALGGRVDWDEASATLSVYAPSGARVGPEVGWAVAVSGALARCKLVPLVDALAFEAHYMTPPQGPRIYLKSKGAAPGVSSPLLARAYPEAVSA